jgi:hypothetical protein
MVECMEGGGWIIALPVQPDREGEQYLLSARLARFYPATTVGSAAELKPAFLGAAGEPRFRCPVREVRQLDFNGLSHAREILLTI